LLTDTKQAILKGFEEADNFYLSNIFDQNNFNSDFDKSGSCALIVIFIDDMCHIANLGDSRALLSENLSQKLSFITNDHKPEDPDEKIRIERAGGHVYQ
jgi:serine/threonine protein phosphatase PrpC